MQNQESAEEKRVDKHSKFYNNSTKLLCQENKMYSTHNKRKFVVAEQFVFKVGAHIKISKYKNSGGKWSNLALRDTDNIKSF